jgi:hypothetical protein
MTVLKSFFCDHDGCPSMMRLAAFLIVSNIMLCWTYVTIRNGRWVPMGPDTIGMIVTVLGAKAWQKRIECHRDGTKK